MWLERASAGDRQVVCVTGEPGIGKTTAVETFIARALEDQPICVRVGRCIEQFGAGEAYLPVLEALERLDRQLGSDLLSDTLRRMHRAGSRSCPRSAIRKSASSSNVRWWASRASACCARSFRRSKLSRAIAP